MLTIFNIIYYLTMHYILHIIDLPMLTVSCLLTDCRSTALRAYLSRRTFSYMVNSQCVSILADAIALMFKILTMRMPMLNTLLDL